MKESEAAMAQVTRRLVEHGDGFALVLDKSIMELLDIGADTPLTLTTNGDALLVSPVRDPERQDRLREALDRINSVFGDDLRRLAE